MILDNKNKPCGAFSSVVGYVKRHKKAFVGIGAFLVTMALWYAIWAFCAWRIGISFILPSPNEVFSEFFRLLPKPEFAKAVLSSLGRVVLGYLIGTVTGAIAALLAYFILPLKVFFSPLVRVVRATPVASFILICVLWMKTSAVPVFIALLMVFPIVYENVLTGLSKTDFGLKEVAKAYGFSGIEKLVYLYIPSALPYFGSASTVSLGLAWKSCVSAEVLSVCAASVGYYIYTSKLYFETEQLFAWTIAIVILSVMLEYLVKAFALLITHFAGRRFVGNGK